MKAILVAAGSQPIEDNFYKTYLEEQCYKVAIDGGIAVFYRLNIIPDYFLGDFDSADHDSIEWCKKNKVSFAQFPCDKDSTDTQLALDYVIQKGYKEILILGALGTRLDHSLANIYLLKYAHEHNVNAKIYHPNHTIQLITPKSSVIVSKELEHTLIFSLIPITPTLQGLTMKGFRWNLNNILVKQGSTLNLSNYLTDNQGTIELSDGYALLIIERDIA